MKRFSGLIFVSLLFILLIANSCSANLTNAPSTALTTTVQQSPVVTPTTEDQPITSLTLTPTPSPVKTPVVLLDNWTNWGPLNWPDEYRTTQGAKLDFIKKEEIAVDGKPAVIYLITVTGLPKDGVYRLWVKSLSNPTPTQLTSEMKIDDSGYLTSEGSRFQLGVQASAKCEAMEFSLMTEDKAEGALGKIIPYPNENKQGAYRLWVELRSKKGDLFAIYGEGFSPNEEVAFMSVSENEKATGKVMADDQGRLNITTLPAVVGKETGVATLTVTGKNGEISISYKWGTEATKTANLTPAPTPTSSTPTTNLPKPQTSPSPTPTIPLPSMDAFMKGIWFNDWGWAFDKPRPPMYGPLYHPPQADVSLKSLATTGANWISVVVGIYQETLSSTSITSNEYRTASDNALRHIIELAHSLGIRVVLVPFVTLSNDPDHSWVQIGSAFTSEKQWQDWFVSYRGHINHYASLAQEAGADMFYVGSELPGTTHREDDWRLVIKEVRERFKGPISYDSVFWGNPTAEYKRIKFWDTLDYIATDFWYSLTNKNDPTIGELKQGWLNTGFLVSLENVSKQFNKPAILSEIGYDSLDGTAKNYSVTNKSGAPEDLQEQADCYRAALETLWGKTWLKGIFWWQWNAISIPKPWPGDPHGKPAEDVLRKFYLSK